jgi:hypothetical protein
VRRRKQRKGSEAEISVMDKIAVEEMSISIAGNVVVDGLNGEKCSYLSFSSTFTCYNTFRIYSSLVSGYPLEARLD